MPHIIVEYTETLSTSEDIPALLTALHNDLAARDTIDIHGIKTRATPIKFVVVGDAQEQDKMIHITLKLLPGRSDELRNIMSKGLADIARAKTHDDRITITVETTELHAESYIK